MDHVSLDMEIEQAPDAPGQGGPGRDRRDGEALVLRTITTHADALLRVARRYSLCADDAHDAYQRAMEVFLRRAATLDAEQAHKWLFTVVKHEAMAVRRKRMDLVGTEEVDLDRHEARHLPSPDEQVASFDRITRTAEALQRLKPQELKAIWLRAQGLSYDEICEATSWTYTKVNRCLTEGRRSFLARYAGIEAGDECRRWEAVLSAIVDGEASDAQRQEVRPHLRNCAACRATVRELRTADRSLAAVLPAAGIPLLQAPAPEPGFVARVVESVSQFLGERAPVSAMKLQAAVEATGATKVAAVAASAAAVAGGGAAVADRVGEPPRAAARAAAAPPPKAAPARRVAVAAPRPEAARTVAASPGGRAGRSSDRSSPKRAPARPRRRTARSPNGTEFAPLASSASAPVAVAPSRPVSPPPAATQQSRPTRAGGAEFGF